MTNCWRKMNNGDWAIFVTDLTAKEGDEVQVHKANGQVQNIRLGKALRLEGTFHLFSPAPKSASVSVANVASAVVAPVVTIDLTNIRNLFDKAKIHLKYPKISLGMPGDSRGLRLTLTGRNSAHPDSINLTSVAASTAPQSGARYGFYGPQRDWYGRVNKDGSLTIGKNAPPAMVDFLKAFAANPAKVAAQHGHLTGNCCFCSKSLTDERSTAVGYGNVCAGHYDLPWGARPDEFAAAVA